LIVEPIAFAFAPRRRRQNASVTTAAIVEPATCSSPDISRPMRASTLNAAKKSGVTRWTLA
jgi:hypothetical protein